MREGPLAELFRATEAANRGEAPASPPAPEPHAEAEAGEKAADDTRSLDNCRSATILPSGSKLRRHFLLKK